MVVPSTVFAVKWLSTHEVIFVASSPLPPLPNPPAPPPLMK